MVLYRSLSVPGPTAEEIFESTKTPKEKPPPKRDSVPTSAHWLYQAPNHHIVHTPLAAEVPFLKGQSQKCSAIGSVESTSDLKQFLKVVRPDWNCPRKKGHSDVSRVLKKLKDIGVTDTHDLIHRVLNNTINEDFFAAGHQRFSKETVESIRKNSHFIRGMENLREPYYRQVGNFAPLRQMKTATNLQHKAERIKRAVEVAAEDKAAKVTNRHKSFVGPRPGTSDATCSGAWGGDDSIGSRFQFPQGGQDDLDETLRPSTVGDPMGPSTAAFEDYHDHFPDSEGSRTSGFTGTAEFSNSSRGSSLFLRHVRVSRHAKALERQLKETMARPPQQGQVSHLFHQASSSPDLSIIVNDADDMDGATPMSTWGDRPRSQSTCRILSGRGRSFSQASPPMSPANGQQSVEGAWSASASVTWGFDDADSVDDQLNPKPFSEKWAKVGSQIQQEPWVAKWGSGHSLLHQGTAMLQEQCMLDERRDLHRSMHLEGKASPLRKHVASKISHRLIQDSERDAQGKIDVEQRCQSIKHNLSCMQTTRSELKEQRRRVEEAIHGPRPKHEHVGYKLEAELFKQVKAKSIMYETAHGHEKKKGIETLLAEEDSPKSTAP